MEPITISVVRHLWGGRPGINLLEITDDDLEKLMEALETDPRFHVNRNDLVLSTLPESTPGVSG